MVSASGIGGVIYMASFCYASIDMRAYGKETTA